MLKKCRLKNFKRFLAQEFELNYLNLLSGMNGMGKSSVIQSFLLLRQSHQQKLLKATGLALNGDLIQIGTAQDALHNEAQQDTIGFEITLDSQECIKWSFDYNSQSDVLSLSSPPVSNKTWNLSLFNDNFQYLRAERLGPRSSFMMSDFQVRQHRQLGTQGEYTAHYLSIFGGSEKIAGPALAHPNETSYNLLLQVEAWLGEISPGTRISLNATPEMDLVNLQFSFSGGTKYRSTNVGFGITYTLPIIVAILAAKPGALLLIENPEAHLHPKGQAQMGELLARAASIGIQVIVETHSDHVLNGIRVAVHGGRLKPDHVALHFFQPQLTPDTPAVVSPKIDRNGRIDQWPDGFFDEWDKSLEALLEPAGE
jgi:predicted ATPase